MSNTAKSTLRVRRRTRVHLEPRKAQRGAIDISAEANLPTLGEHIDGKAR
jgi:hypothetical protein